LTFLVVDVEPPADGVAFIGIMLLKSGLFNVGIDGFTAPGLAGRGGFDPDAFAFGGRGWKPGGLGVFLAGGFSPYDIFRVL
jgi:hypothetical protein